jgi:hypothetical protein
MRPHDRGVGLGTPVQIPSGVGVGLQPLPFHIGQITDHATPYPPQDQDCPTPIVQTQDQSSMPKSTLNAAKNNSPGFVTSNLMDRPTPQRG